LNFHDDGHPNTERAIEQFLCARNFALRDGKTLEPTDGGVFSLLAVRD